MDRASRNKASGYFTSTLSVVLLGIPAYKSAAEDPWMLTSLILGMGLSIIGMALRWRGYRVQRQLP